MTDYTTYGTGNGAGLGFVTLLGAGPGTAEHLTLAGLRAISQAEIILYDALLSASLRALLPATARQIYVGKRCGRHAKTQDEINALLVQVAQTGKRIVRLKGGDPFIFGRGAEEVAALRTAGVPYRVLPGVSALNGVAAAFDLPLTSRDGGNEFRAIQGHHLPQDPAYWQDLAHYRGTLVIFMGTLHIGEIAARLLVGGAAPDKAIALLETRPNGTQNAVRTTLGAAAVAGISKQTDGPGIIYIGDNIAFMSLAPASAAPMLPKRRSQRIATEEVGLELAAAYLS